jgi:hypothetical protein
MGCLAVLAVPFMAVCFFVGVRLGDELGGVLGVALAALAMAGLLRSWRRFMSPIRARIKEDLANTQVEVLAISSAQVLNVPATHSSVDPTFVIELEGNRVLILLGQWLAEMATFGGKIDDSQQDDTGHAYANGLPPPWAFPTSAFTLHRFPWSGEVLKIELKGPYVAPVEIGVSVDLVQINDAPSRIVEGTVADLPAAVQRLATR